MSHAEIVGIITIHYIPMDKPVCISGYVFDSKRTIPAVLWDWCRPEIADIECQFVPLEALSVNKIFLYSRLDFQRLRLEVSKL